MGNHVFKHRRLLAGVVALAVILFTMQGRVYGQQGGGGGRANQPAPTARASAPFDPTGYWVSLITNSWRLRMVPPALRDYQGIPVSAAGKKLADTWDPAKDEAAGTECKHFGAASIMYQPTRLHVTWQDDNTLRIDTDLATQTRLLQFGNLPAAPGPRTWQGRSVATWEARRAGRQVPPNAKYLKATTTNMRPGYLRRNGVPYGESAVLTEYFELFQEHDGSTMMFITAIVEDPVYLETRYITISQFRKEPDGAKWDPTPCSARR